MVASIQIEEASAEACSGRPLEMVRPFVRCLSQVLESVNTYGDACCETPPFLVGATSYLGRLQQLDDQHAVQKMVQKWAENVQKKQDE